MFWRFRVFFPATDGKSADIQLSILEKSERKNVKFAKTGRNSLKFWTPKHLQNFRTTLLKHKRPIFGALGVIRLTSCSSSMKQAWTAYIKPIPVHIHCKK